MASKKQRRRRSKERRHEWEYIYVDEEGEEVEVAEQEASARPRKSEAKAAAKQPAARGGRRVDPPSWSRVARRALIFAPLMLVVVYLLQGKKHDYTQAIVQTLILVAFFMPFSYFMDTLMYRSFRKRQGRATDAKRR